MSPWSHLRGCRFMVCLLAAILFTTFSRSDEPMLRHWTASAYPPSFEHISLEQGLSQSTVHCILQDRKGFLWFGTDVGLNRYDGFRFQVFRREANNPNSLCDDWITCLLEDRRGYLWIGTRKGGVTILDLETMVMVPKLGSAETEGLPSKAVNAIKEDREGNVWLATELGLAMVSREWKMPDKLVFRTFLTSAQDPAGAPTGALNGMYCDRKGTLWIGSRRKGLGRLVSNPGNGKLVFEYFALDPPLPDASPPILYAMEEDPFGQLWLGGKNGLFTFDPNTGRFQRWKNLEGESIHLGENRVLGILRDSTGTMWVAGDGAGLLRALPRLHPQDPVRFARYVRDAKDSRSLSGNGLQCVFEDRSGVLWVSAYQRGLNKLVLNPGRSPDREVPSVFQYRNNAGEPFSLSGDTVSTIGEDRFGHLWIGTDGNGLNRVRPPTPGQPLHFERFRADPLHGQGRLQSDVILTTHLDSQKQLWLGTFNAGLVRVNQQTATAPPTFTHFRNNPKDLNSLGGNFIRCILDDEKGGFWVALNGQGLNHFDPRTGKAKRYEWGTNSKGPGHGNLYWMAKDAFGTIWIATQAGLNRFNPQTEEFRLYRPGGPNSLSELFLNTVHVDEAGILWVGTKGGGLNKAVIPPWNGPEPQFTAFGTREGLPGNEIKSILSDGKGNLWLSGSRALCRFNTAGGKAYPFTWQAELRKAEFIWNACFRSASSEMFFGSNDGLTLFHPHDIIPNKIAPSLAITNFQIHNKPLPLWDRTTNRSWDKSIQEITLGPKDSIISFDFAALHFVAPEQNQYAYLMEGLDKAWNEAGNKHSISFTTLPPGDYVLRVTGSNCDGVRNEKELRLKIHVLPPWYKTGWFRMLILGGTAGAVLGIYKLRTRNLRRRQIQLITKVDAATRELRWEVQERVQAEVELRHHREHLEQMVQDRTLELQATNERLQEEVVVRERKEEELRQAQKLESMGRLAGGVAHDFNNLLTVINGYSDLMMSEGLDSPDLPIYAEQIRKAGERAAGLTRQLLAFSRKQVLKPEILDLSRLVIDLQTMLGRLLPENIDLQVQVDPDPCWILADPSQMVQIVMNLAVNARDAMPSGGQFRIEIDHTELDAESLGDRTYVKPGSYVRLLVMDTGVGMDEATQSRIFEPFFTTKELGKGTGLGLSTVFGIVKQSDGYIWVYSEAGKGTNFKIYFPVAQGSRVPSTGAGVEPSVERLSGTILVAEDQEAVRRLVVRTLESRGFLVLEACNGEEALTLAKDFDGRIDLLFTDMVMPIMDGQELARRVKELRSEMLVSFSSGYAESLVMGSGVLDPGMNLLQKPFSPSQLLVFIQNVLVGAA